MAVVVTIWAMAIPVAVVDAQTSGIKTSAAAKVGPPPAEAGLPSYYRKYVDAAGIAVLGAGNIPDQALLDTRKWIVTMLSANAGIRQAMAGHKAMVVILPENEPITSVPTMDDLPQRFPNQDWSKRRGGGGTLARPLTWMCVENVLHLPTDNFPNENNMVHEFAHAIENVGIALSDKELHERLSKAYAAATARGLWKGTYAGKNMDEYFAEGTQSWFHCNRKNDRDHNDVDTRAKLKKYDPELAAILKIVYGDLPNQSMKRRGEK
jgi:alpha-glucosidase